MKILCIVAILLIATPSAIASAKPDRVLVAVDNSTPLTARQLLAEELMVVRDMGGYLLAAVTVEQLPRLDALDLAWEVLDRSVTGKTYYTIGYMDSEELRRLVSGVRPLKITEHSAVVEATPAEAERLSAAGLEIASVFMRPIRLRAEHKTRPPTTSAVPDRQIQAMVDAVSGSSVDGYVRRLQDFETRHSWHDSCAAAADYIKDEFESFGLEVTFHHFRDVYNDNVVGVKRGVGDPNRQVVIGGHYDSITSNQEDAPGADDNASGTSCVLECARVVSDYQFDFTIVFIAFCGEEQGLVGSEAYAAEAATRGDDILAMINVDMIGYIAPADILDLDVIADASSAWLATRIVTLGNLYVPDLPVVTASRLPRGSSDHASFWANGYDAVLFHEDTGNSSPYIHTTNDTIGLSYNAPALAERSVKAAVAIVADLAHPVTEAKPEPIYALEQNRPNPFNIATTIDYKIDETTHVRLSVYDVRGRLVRTLVDEVQSPQPARQATWDGRDDRGESVASGIYLYRIVTENFVQTRKLALLK
jgi:hypothetical protein